MENQDIVGNPRPSRSLWLKVSDWADENQCILYLVSTLTVVGCFVLLMIMSWRFMVITQAAGPKKEPEKPVEVVAPPASTESSKSVNKDEEVMATMNSGIEYLEYLEKHNAWLSKVLEEQLPWEYHVFGDIKFVPEDNSVAFTGFPLGIRQKLACSMRLNGISVAVRTEGEGVSIALRNWEVLAGTREDPEAIKGHFATILVPNVKVAAAWLRAIERWKKEREEYLAKFQPRVILPPKEDKKKEPF